MARPGRVVGANSGTWVAGGPLSFAESAKCGHPEEQTGGPGDRRAGGLCAAHPSLTQPEMGNWGVVLAGSCWTSECVPLAKLPSSVQEIRVLLVPSSAPVPVSLVNRHGNRCVLPLRTGATFQHTHQGQARVHVSSVARVGGPLWAMDVSKRRDSAVRPSQTGSVRVAWWVDSSKRHFRVLGF